MKEPSFTSVGVYVFEKKNTSLIKQYLIQENDALKLGAAIVQDRSHYFWFLGKKLFIFYIWF